MNLYKPKKSLKYLITKIFLIFFFAATNQSSFAETKVRFYICNDSENKSAGYKKDFFIEESYVIEKSANSIKLKNRMFGKVDGVQIEDTNIEELIDCKIIDQKNWQCNKRNLIAQGSVSKNVIVEMNQIRKVIDGKFYFTNLDMQNPKYRNWCQDKFEQIK